MRHHAMAVRRPLPDKPLRYPSPRKCLPDRNHGLSTSLIIPCRTGTFTNSAPCHAEFRGKSRLRAAMLDGPRLGNCRRMPAPLSDKQRLHESDNGIRRGPRWRTPRRHDVSTTVAPSDREQDMTDAPQTNIDLVRTLIRAVDNADHNAIAARTWTDCISASEMPPPPVPSQSSSQQPSRFVLRSPICVTPSSAYGKLTTP